MFNIHDFKNVCRVLAVYTANYITPMDVMMRLRSLNKNKEIVALALAFEEMPGYSNYLIQEFIDMLRMKVVVQ